MPQHLYLIRHTRPDVAPGICYGQLDLDLAASFAQEAQRILCWLPPLELVFTSPLLRCKRLGEYLAQRQHCALHSDARLMEKHCGAWEGRMWDDIARDEIDAWAADVLGYAPPGGESTRQLLLRAGSFLAALAQLPQRHIAIVAHGGSIRAMLALLAEVPLTQTLDWRIEYGTVISLRR
jgi:alpha-ribazole phosphatase